MDKNRPACYNACTFFCEKRKLNVGEELEMKKWLIAIVILMLCCASAYAETLEVNPEDVTLDLSAAHHADVELADQAAFANAGADTVVRDGTNYIVDTGALKLKLNMARYPSVLCFTQDKYASFEAYLAVDPAKLDELLNWLITDKINFFLLDLETNMEVYIYTHEADNASLMIGNLSTLSDDNMNVVTSRIFPGATALQAGSTRWIQASDSAMLTIVNNQYVVVEFGGSGDPAGDLQDTLAIVSNLTIE